MNGLLDAGDRRRAQTDFATNLVIVAGAGTGKTSLLTARVLCALIGREIAPSELLVTTFTEKAAGEMAERIEQGLLELAESGPLDDGDAARARATLHEEFGLDDAAVAARAGRLTDVELPLIETFHAFCLRVLVEFARDADLPPDARIADELDVDELFDEFWNRLLDDELGEQPRRDRILDDAGWEALLANPGLDMAKRALHEWCLRPQLRDLEIDADDGLVRTRLSEVVTTLAELAERYAQPAKFQENTLPALETARAILASSDRPSEATVDAARAFIELGSRPTISKKTPEPARTEMKTLQRALQKLLVTWTRLPDRAGLAALAVLLRGAGDRFELARSSRSLLTFDDCLVRCKRLLRDTPRVRRTLCERFTQILVDEFQDTDPLQYDILFYLAQRDPASAERDPAALELAPGKLCIVGDPKQSIYRFRGADMEAFDAACACILDQGGARLHLSTNFRSRSNVLELVNRALGDVFVESPGFQPPYEALAAPGPDGAGASAGRRVTVGASAERADERRAGEARALARLVRDDVAEGARYRDFAFLFRAFLDAELYARELRQAGIPALVEGGKKFYERHEVERLLALLQVLVRPHDEAALLACLRSPLCAVPDQELAQAAAEGLLPGRLLVERDADATLPPRLTAAIAMLEDLVERARGSATEDVLRLVLDATPLRAIEAAGYDGAQRLANVEALVDRVARWAHDGGRGLDAAVARLAREASRQVEAEESPLADPDADSVRLMTIHKAKGLEFDTVVVPDIGRDSRAGHFDGCFHVFRPAGGAPRVLVNLDSMQSPALPLHVARHERHENAEELRLVYVALTRARRHVVLSSTNDPKRNSPWHDVLDAASGLLEPVALTPTGTGLGPKLGAGFDLDAVAALVDARRSYRADRCEHARPALRAPSSVEAAEPRTGPRGSRFPRAIGSTVHAYLAAADLGSREVDAVRLRAIAELEAARVPEARAATRICRDAGDLLEGLFESELGARLARVHVIGREIPVLYAGGDGKRWHGSIDIAFEDEGRLVVADFKTDAGEPDTLVARYASQLEHYAAAVTRAWQLPATPGMELLLLRRGIAVTVQA